jgi:hypothetical protein
MPPSPPSPPSPSLINLTDGADVLEALAAAASGTDAWLQAVGQIEDVELRVAGEGADPRKRWRGRFVVASLVGPAGGPFGVVLAREVEGTTQVVAGQLMGARSAGLTVLVQPLLVAASQSLPEPAVRALAHPEPAPQAPVIRAPEPGSSWARSAVTAAALARKREPEPEQGLYPDPGDLVHHFAFGLCDVLTSSGDSLRIRDRNGPGRLREIRLDKLQVKEPTEHDGKRLFKLERKP